MGRRRSRGEHRRVAPRSTHAAGTARTPADYVARTGTATIPAGAASVKVIVRVIRDRTAEPDERFTVRLSGAIGATIADGRGLGTIVSDD